MVTRVVQPSSDRPLLRESGAPSTQFNTWLKVITDNSLIIGDVDPEGVVEASQGALYMDSTGLSGSVLYIKRDADTGGDKALGWILV